VFAADNLGFSNKMNQIALSLNADGERCFFFLKIRWKYEKLLKPAER
jgi:hypothetical protein